MLNSSWKKRGGSKSVMKARPGLNKDSVVLVLEPQSSIRMLLTESMRILEFNTVKGFGSGREALDYLQDNPVSWIIMSPMLDQDINCLHILKIITQNLL